jgi:hypothetical protein
VGTVLGEAAGEDLHVAGLDGVGDGGDDVAAPVGGGGRVDPQRKPQTLGGGA